MESEEENDQIFRQLKKQKSVKIADDRTEIVEVREKHGPLYKSIPKLPIAGAVICCLLNIIIPGFGTLISAFTVLCGAPTALNKRTTAFLFNLLSAFLQMITFIIIVGWVWSILWGMNMVTLARTLISAFTVLCGAPTALNNRTAAFLFNLLSAFLQMITFIIIVGWVWSILWGMNMVTLARTLISAFTVLCGAPTALKKRTAAFLFNLLLAFLQMNTFIIIVGWVWNILWRMNMVTLAMNWGEEKRTPYYCRRQSSIDVP